MPHFTTLCAAAKRLLGKSQADAFLDASEQEGYDLIYCAGLFDYLADETCRAVVELLYRNLRPGGLVVVANMKDDKPFRNFIEFVLDWHLIYRDNRKMSQFAPHRLSDTSCVEAEETAVNLFLRLRRPG